MFKIQKKDFYALFLVTLLIAEFYYIEIYTGFVRIYHIWAILITLLLLPSFYRLLNSTIFLSLIVFVVVNMVAVLLSDSPGQAFVSFLSFLLYFSIAIATALMLLKNKLSIQSFMRIILVMTIFSVIWGLIQILTFKALGLSLALSEAQDSQIQIGFGPGFRQEANGFGKYLMFPFLLFLPTMIKNPKSRLLRVAFLVMGLGIIMNFTRTAIIGMAVAFIFTILWYLFQGKFALLMQRSTKIFMGIFLTLLIIFFFPGTFSEYGKYKIDNFFNAEETVDGGSSKYRLEAMQGVLDQTLNDDKRILIGNGWGQTYIEIRGQLIQAGGGDWVNILGYSGITGLIFYLLYSFIIFFVLVRAARRSLCEEDRNFTEGVLIAFIGIFTTSFLSGFMIFPEYWLVIGISMYIGLKSKKIKHKKTYEV